MENIFKTITDISLNIKEKIFDNFTDDIQKNTQQICDDIFQDIVSSNKEIKSIVSKETQTIQELNPSGKYILTYVAIDNPSHLDLNFSLGTIIAIYEKTISNKTLKYSSYITYGPTFGLVFSDEKDVSFYSYIDEKFQKQQSFELNQKGKINSTAGDRPSFSLSHKNLMQSFFDEGYRLRFSDSLALDTHQIIFKKGGLYSSPATNKDPNGTIYLAFEAYPISSIITNLGGKAIDGKQNILDIPLKDISQTTPFYFGSSYEVDKVLSYEI